MAGAGLTLVLVTVLLTYSRGGILALAMAVAVTMAFLPRRGEGLAALAAGVAGCLLPAAFALTDPLLSADQIPTALREDAGAGLGWRLAVGLAAGAVLAVGLARWAARLHLDPARVRRLGAVVVAVLLVGGRRHVRGQRRRARLGGRPGGRVPGRGRRRGRERPRPAGQRLGQPAPGLVGGGLARVRGRPVLGTGAGGFPLVHLRERANGDDALNTRESHDIVLRTLSGTGAIGLALLAALIVAVIAGALRAAERHPGPEIGLPLAVLAAFALQAVVDWSWAIPALTVPALAAAGVVLAPRRRPTRLVAGAIGALVAVAVLSAVLPWWSGRVTREGGDALADGRAGVRSTSRGTRARPTPCPPRPCCCSARPTRISTTCRGPLGAYQAATRLQPANPETWRALAIFLGPDRTAAAAWRQVHRLDPQDPEAAIRAGLGGGGLRPLGRGEGLDRRPPGRTTEAAQPRHERRGLPHDPPAHLRAAVEPLGEGDRDLDDAEPEHHRPVGHLDLEAVAGRRHVVEGGSPPGPRGGST